MGAPGGSGTQMSPLPSAGGDSGPHLPGDAVGSQPSALLLTAAAAHVLVLAWTSEEPRQSQG